MTRRFKTVTSVLAGLVFVLSAILLSGCSSPSPPPPSTGTIFGTVSVPSEASRMVVKSLGSVRGTSALNGATVTAVGPETKSATTGSDGHFELNLKPGTYEVTIGHPNYVAIKFSSVVVTAGERRDLSERLGTFRYLIIDIGDYDPDGYGDEGTDPLDLSPGPENDAALLKSTLEGNVWARAITQVENTQATKAGIKAAIDQIVAAADWQDYIVVYYSGHGTAGSPDASNVEPSGDGINEYIVSHDLDFISDDELEAWFKDAKTQDIVFIFDSCHSGGMTKQLVRKPLQEPAGGTAMVTRDLNKPGYVVLMAADDDETAQQGPTGEGGVPQGYFTFALCYGISSRGADVDQNRIITAVEAFRYAKAPFDDDPTLGQNPQLWQGNGADIPLYRY